MYNGARELDRGSTVQVHSTGTKCSSTCGHVAGSTVSGMTQTLIHCLHFS